MAKTFAAQIGDFVEKTERNLNAVFKQSAGEVFEIAQTPKSAGGRMPIDTGILRASLKMSLNGQPTGQGEAAYIATVARAEFGDVVRGEYTVDYAMRQEYGFVGTDSLGREYNQKGNFFVGNAVGQWQNIVTKNARLLAQIQGGAR